MLSIREAVALNVLGLRRDRGLTQAQLAKAAGLAQSTVACVETERHGCSIDVLFKLARVLRVPPQRLLSGVDYEYDEDDYCFDQIELFCE